MFRKPEQATHNVLHDAIKNNSKDDYNRKNKPFIN